MRRKVSIWGLGVCWGFLFLYKAWASVPASPFKDLLNHLAPIEARLVVSNGKYYLNLGVRGGVRPGEWWSIYRPGKSILDPITGERLGFEEERVAIARVIRTAPSYAEVRLFCLNESCRVESGFLARRFAELDFYFFDLSGGHHALYEALRARFPWFRWHAYRRLRSRQELPHASTAVSLVVEKEWIYLYSNGKILGVYSLGETGGPEFLSPSSRGSTSLVGQIKELVYYLEIQRFDTGLPFVIYLTRSGLHLQRLGGTEHYVYRYRGFGEIVNFSAGPQRLIAINIFDGQKMLSRLLRFDKGNFVKVSQDADYILQFFDFDLDGIKDTLVGQPFDREEFFGPGLHILLPSEGKLRRLQRLEVPPGFRIFGSFMLDLNGDRRKEIGFFNVGQKLVIFQENSKLWVSPLKFGGSVQVIQMDNLEPEFPTPKNILVWSSPQVVRWQGYPLVFLPYNRFGFWGATLSGIEYGTIAVLYFSNRGYVLAFWKKKFRGAVQSVFADRENLYMVVVEGNFFKGQGNSKILKVSFREILSQLDVHFP